GILEFRFDRGLNCLGFTFPVVAVDGDPGYDGNLRNLQQALGDVLVHADGGAEDARANKRQTGKIKQSLNRAVFAEGAVHHGENHVDALAAAAAVQSYERRVGGVGGHHHALATFQDFGQHFLRTCADEPVAFLSDADGHGLVFVRVEATND